LLHLLLLLRRVQVGVGNLTPAQQRSHFALWALVKAPLLIGADLADITDASLKILLAKEVGARCVLVDS
jgi:alpha-galactosidase